MVKYSKVYSLIYLILLSLTFNIVLTLYSNVYAATPTPTAPGIHITPNTAAPGDTLHVDGVAFDPNVQIIFLMQGANLSDGANVCKSDSTGSFSNCPIFIPSSLSSQFFGNQTVYAYKSDKSIKYAFSIISIIAPTPTPYKGELLFDPNSWAKNSNSDINVSGSKLPPKETLSFYGSDGKSNNYYYGFMKGCQTDATGKITGTCKLSSFDIQTYFSKVPAYSGYQISAVNISNQIVGTGIIYCHAPTPSPGSKNEDARCSDLPTLGYYGSPCGLNSYVNDPTHPEHSAECKCTYDKKAGIPNGSTYTAIGCLSSNLGTTINTFLSILIGIATIVSLLRIVIGGYEIMTNPAGPDEIQEGQQIITSAVLGLLFIILSIVILKIIGVDILGLSYLSQIFSS